MTTTQISVLVRVDEALDEIQRLRERIVVQASSAERSAGLAQLADSEARWWSVLVEQSRTRVHWRAALSAREYARQSALSWRRRAVMQRAREAGGAT
jgi:D-serine deaminase-like pyridoxal phosphate-dependent protein